MRPKLTLQDLKFIPKPEPIHPTREEEEAMVAARKAVIIASDPMRPPALSCKELPQAVWCPLGPNWLRVVMDERSMTKRIYRIELYDKDRKERRAVFRRQTEATRR